VPKCEEQVLRICSIGIAFDAVADLARCQPSATDAQQLARGAAKIAACYLGRQMLFPRRSAASEVSTC